MALIQFGLLWNMNWRTLPLCNIIKLLIPRLMKQFYVYLANFFQILGEIVFIP